MSENRTYELELERVRAEASNRLSAHELACERRYGELRSELVEIRAHGERNLRLLYILLGGMLAVAARSFWPGLFS